MPNNSTVEIISAVNDGYNIIWLYVTWIIFFFTTALPNLIVTLTIMRYSALRDRKEYLVVAGLSFVDFIKTGAYSIAGKYLFIAVALRPRHRGAPGCLTGVLIPCVRYLCHEI